MTVNVLTTPEAIARVVKGYTVVIERARGPSYLGERGEARDFWNLTTCTGKTPLAQGDTAKELQRWAKKQGARRAEIID